MATPWEESEGNGGCGKEAQRRMDRMDKKRLQSYDNNHYSSFFPQKPNTQPNI